MNAKTSLSIAAAAALFALAACQKPAPAVDTAKETAAINAQIDGFNAAVKARDAEKTVAIDAADVVIYGSGQPTVKGKDEDLKGTKEAFADPGYSFNVKAETTQVAKSGEMAVQTGTYESSATNPKTKAVDHMSGNWVGEWRKEADGWKLAAVSTAAGAPPAPAAAAAPTAPAAAPKT